MSRRLNESLFYSRRIGARPNRVLENVGSIIGYPNQSSDIPTHRAGTSGLSNLRLGP
jgi:hypothetical protein